MVGGGRRLGTGDKAPPQPPPGREGGGGYFLCQVGNLFGNYRPHHTTFS